MSGLGLGVLEIVEGGSPSHGPEVWEVGFIDCQIRFSLHHPAGA